MALQYLFSVQNLNSEEDAKDLTFVHYDRHHHVS